jgi:chaperonin GroEL
MRRTSHSKPKKDFQTPGIVFQPQVAEGMQHGFDKLVDLIRPTLGPLPHIVAIEKVIERNQLPELLDSGGTIARRVIQIPNRLEDVGFMFLRQALWRQQEREGDGTATTAVLFQAVFDAGRHYLVAGGNAMGLRRHLENGLRLITTELERQTTQLYGKQKLTGLALTICHDDEMAKMMGEIFDIIGAYGQLDVRKGSGRELVREYIEGMFWECGLYSREMANDEHGLRANLENAAILISNLEIESPEQLIPLLEMAVKNEIKQLLMISQTLSDRAMGLLLAKPNRERIFVVAVKIPGISLDVQYDAMTDLAILTGGRALSNATGATLENVRLEDLGRARRVWADKEFFGIIGGRGDARLIRQHIAGLRQRFRNVKDTDEGKRLLERIGKLLGGSATLSIGGHSPISIEARMELAKRTAVTMRGAMRDGVVPGGGIALLACRKALHPFLKNAKDTDELAAYSILLQALEVPFRTIVSNAGIVPGSILADAEHRGPGYGYDAVTRQVVDMQKAGLYDAVSVVKGAVHTAIASAALALTTEVIVNRRNPPEMLNP